MLNTILGSLSSGVAASTGSYESIASATGTGSSNTITFNSIPSGYSSLQIRCNMDVVSSGGLLVVKVNGDTGANYTYHSLEGSGSAVAAAGSGATSTAYFGFFSSGTSSTYPAVSIIDVIDYASTTKYKTLRAFNGCDVNGAGGSVALNSVLWMSTSAITSISLTDNNSNYTSTATFALYGIKGA